MRCGARRASIGSAIIRLAPIRRQGENRLAMTPLRAMLAWLVLLAVAFANGTLRVVAYPASLGDFAARQVAAGVGAVALGAATWALLRRWPIPTARTAWATGALWAGLTAVFEAGMGRAGGHPWAEILGQWAVWRGSLWPLVVLWVLAAPAVISAVQRSGVALGPALGWAIAGWAACGATLGIARAVAGIDVALLVHLAAAPLVGAAATRLVWRNPRHPGPLATAALVAGTPALLDGIVVAPFLERSFAMFASVLGTWLPLGLILAASFVTASRLARAGRPGTAPGGLAAPIPHDLSPRRIGRLTINAGQSQRRRVDPE